MAGTNSLDTVLLNCRHRRRAMCHGTCVSGYCASVSSFLELSSSGVNGTIPTSLFKLTRLTYVGYLTDRSSFCSSVLLHLQRDIICSSLI